MRWIIVYGFIFTVSVVSVVHAMEQQNRLSDINRQIPLTSLVIANGYTYAQKMRNGNITTIDLPQKQFDMAQQAEETASKDVCRKIKRYIGTKDLTSMWAKSYEIFKQKKKNPSSDAVTALAYSPRGLLVYGKMGDTAVHLWPVTLLSSTHEPIDELRADIPYGQDNRVGRIHSLAFCSNNTTLLGGLSYAIDVWDIDAAQRTLRLKIPNNTYVTGVVAGENMTAFSFKNCSSIISPVTLWSLQDGSNRKIRENGLFRVQSIATSPNGINIAMGIEAGYVELWDMRKLEDCYARCSALHARKFDSLVFLNDTTIVAASSTFSEISMFDCTTGLRIKEFANGFCTGALARLDDTVFAAACRKFSAIADAELRIFDIEQGCINRIPCDFSMYSPLACAFDDTIACGHYDDGITLFRPTKPAGHRDIDRTPFAAYGLAAMHTAKKKLT
jgi:WD40 repeat protein